MDRIDWGRPWFAALDAGEACAGCIADGRLDLGPLNAAAASRSIRTESGRSLNFVDARTIGPDGGGAAGYERRIFGEGRVATRTSGDGAIHDLFNALIWLRFPRAKARLNALQVQALDAPAAAGPVRADGADATGGERGPGAARGPLRDAITLFDESGLVLATAQPQLLESLSRREWSAALIAGRARWLAAVRAIPFGHGLLQKLVAPYKALTAHAWILPLEPGVPGLPGVPGVPGVPGLHGVPGAPGAHAEPDRDRIDAALAEALQAATLAHKPFVPLPVLGIPGWWPENRDPAFYNDRKVFRPARAQSSPPADGVAGARPAAR
ncbi:MAG: DUF3025 domain-containing protein [Burkholderiales bacterium]|nr:MAG: DUF3025 domain-containing protein [Burkholderiales bacterium]